MKGLYIKKLLKFYWGMQKKTGTTRNEYIHCSWTEDWPSNRCQFSPNQSTNTMQHQQKYQQDGRVAWKTNFKFYEKINKQKYLRKVWEVEWESIIIKGWNHHV